MLVVLFVTATISQSAVLREKRGQIYLATAKPCTAQHRTAAQQIYLATALVSKLQGKHALMPMPSVLKCSVVVEELLHLKVHSSSFYSAQ